MAERKRIWWEASARRDLAAFPQDARREAGFQLDFVQQGVNPTDWKPMPSVGPGVREIRVHTRLEHRVLYVAHFEEAIYVLHAFEKRSQKTAQADIQLARTRLAKILRDRPGRAG